MAGFADLITELETIANAQSGVNTFKYADVWDVNGFKNTEKVMMLVDRDHAVQYQHFNSNKGQRIYQYAFKWFWYNDFKQDDTQSLPQAIEELQDIADQYLAKFFERYEDNADTRPWEVVNLDDMAGSIDFPVHQDKYVQFLLQPIIELKTDCDDGTFDFT